MPQRATAPWILPIGSAVLLSLLCTPSALAFTTVQHSAAARNAHRRTCSRDFIIEADAVRFINDPDCIGNDCNTRDITTGNPSGFDRERQEDYSLVWACRNWDHFSDQQVGGPRQWGTITDTTFGEFSNNGHAYSELLNYAKGRARAARITVAPEHPDFRRQWEEARRAGIAAMRAAYRAAHYATDAVACGHLQSNRWCNWQDPEPSAHCRAFVDNISNQSTLANPFKQWLGPSGTVNLCSGQPQQYPPFGGLHGTYVDPNPDLRAAGFQPTRGMGYAAAERYIRHYSRGRYLIDSFGGRWKNECPTSGCDDGECLAVGPNAPPIAQNSEEEQRILGDITTQALEAVCAELPFETDLVPNQMTEPYRQTFVHGERGLVTGRFLKSDGTPLDTRGASSLPLPTQIDGIELEWHVRGKIVKLPLFAVSAGQINFHFPANERFPPEKTPYDYGDFFVRRNRRVIGKYLLEVRRGPALRFFTANGTGKGAAHGHVVGPDGRLKWPLANCSSGPGSCELNHIPTDGNHSIILYASGFGNSDQHFQPSEVRVNIDDHYSVPWGSPLYMGPEGLPGLDKLTFHVPAAMCTLADTVNPYTRGPHEFKISKDLPLLTSNVHGLAVKFCKCVRGGPSPMGSDCGP